MNSFKTITICGKMTFFSTMLEVAKILSLQGYIVLAPFVIAENDDIKTMLDSMHFAKIDRSDAIYVVNINGYIGYSTGKEIAYAKEHGKEIIYHESIIE